MAENPKRKIPFMNTGIERRGLLLVLSSPSGAGKTSLVKALLERNPDLAVSVSATTRPKRPNEIEGQDYFFVTPERFQDMVAEEEFLEYASIFGYSYGTPKWAVLDRLNNGHDIIFDIDWQGTQQLAQFARSDLVSVFILPPSIGELEKRLHQRGADSEQVVAYRMSRAQNEISHWAEYDYVMINDDFEKAVAQIESILKSERLKRTRQKGLVDFVKGLHRGA